MQLDIAMVERLAQYLSTIRATQFIIVSLRPHMYEYSPCLVGVYRRGVQGIEGGDTQSTNI
jgi:chromosome segregation ATPase